jgi:hypothetical protein
MGSNQETRFRVPFEDVTNVQEQGIYLTRAPG